MSENFRWAPVIAELERVFRRLGMERHLAQLTRFRAGYERQCAKLATMPRPPWTSESLVELAAVFQVAPFEARYPVVPDDKRCPFCRADLAGRQAAPVCGVYVDRTLYQCRKCAGRWLLLKT